MTSYVKLLIYRVILPACYFSTFSHHDIEVHAVSETVKIIKPLPFGTCHELLPVSNPTLVHKLQTL